MIVFNLFVMKSEYEHIQTFGNEQTERQKLVNKNPFKKNISKVLDKVINILKLKNHSKDIEGTIESYLNQRQLEILHDASYAFHKKTIKKQLKIKLTFSSANNRLYIKKKLKNQQSSKNRFFKFL